MTAPTGRSGGDPRTAVPVGGLPPEQAAELREIALFPEMNPGPVARLDLDATVLRANRAATEVFGAGIVGSCWKDAVPAVTDEMWERILAGDERFWVEAELNGRHLGFTILRAPESSQVFVYGADITNLKRAERRLAELARFPEMNPGPVLRLERDGKILLANRAARTLFRDEGLMGRSWPELCPGMTEELWAKVLRSDGTFDHEVQIGGRHILLIHIHDEPTDQVFVYGADLTQLKTAERALSQAERMATLGTLAAGVAHELNNPAAAAQRAAEHLQDILAKLQQAQMSLSRLSPGPEVLDRLSGIERSARARAGSPEQLDPLTRSDLEYDVENWLDDRDIEDGWELAPCLVGLGYGPPELDELAYTLPPDHLAPVIQWMSRTYPVYQVLEEIRHGTGRISEIVSALKAYSYVGQAPVQSVDVNEGIRHTLVILRNKLKQGVSLQLELDPELPRIQAYGGDLNQVWTNLIDNAVDAMAGEGHLTVRSAAEPDGIRVEVEDSGPGIPSEIQGQIFDPFFTTKEPGHGTGLGLHTTYNIVVEKHHGGIELRSQPGRTVFVIRLPRALDEIRDESAGDLEASSRGLRAPTPEAGTNAARQRQRNRSGS